MRKLSQKDEHKKIRSLKLTDDIWRRFLELKPRNKTWDLCLKEILDTFDFIKNLKN